MIRISRPLAVRHAFCFCLLICASLAQTTAVMPTIEGESFTGRKITLPDAARGMVAVLIFGFTKASKEPTSAWADKIQAEFGPRAGFEMYQLPVLEEVPRLFRGMVISGMKKGVRENMRDHFVPILQHESELKSFVGYHEKDDAYLVVLDASGQVIRQMHGPFSDAAYSELRSEIQKRLGEHR